MFHQSLSGIPKCTIASWYPDTIALSTHVRVHEAIEDEYLDSMLTAAFPIIHVIIIMLKWTMNGTQLVQRAHVISVV